MSNNSTPPVPRPRITTLFGGMAVVAAGFAAWWYGLLRKQARKDERGAYTPWEYRILQAQASAGNPDRPVTLAQRQDTPYQGLPTPGVLATHPQPESDVGPESSQARAVPNAPQTQSGKSADPNTGPSAGPERTS